MRPLILVIAAALLVGCDLPSGALPPRTGPFGGVEPVPGVTVIQTFITAADDGAPVAAAIQLVLDSAAWRMGMRLGGSESVAGTDSIEIASDTRGLAATTVTYGQRSGRAVLRMRVPSTGASDSIVYELSDRNVRYIDAYPVTPAYVGESVVLHWVAYDTAWHPVFGDPTVTVGDTAIAAFVYDTALAKETGFTWIRVFQGAAVDSVPLAVVPRGRLGALETDFVWTQFDMNGVVRTRVFGGSSSFSGPRFSPSGDSLAYCDGPNIRLRVPGPATVRLVPAALGFTFDRQASWSGDGQWVFFTAGYADGRTEIWRIRPDGSAAMRAGPAAAAGERDAEPSVSADGALLAFTTNRTLAGGQPTVRVISVATGTTVYSGPAGTAPRISRAGTRIAFRSGGSLMLANTDGSGLRTLTPTLTQYSGQLSWSPDDRWIAVAHSDGAGVRPYIYLVDTTKDTAIRLPYAFGWTMPDWR